MKVTAIVLCRMDSRRLPGKVLKEVHGRPLIWYSVTRCKQIRDLDVVIATTDRDIDNPIADWALSQNLQLFRGAVNNVARRIVDCIEYFGTDYFFRVNADSPFLEPCLIEKAYNKMLRSDFHFVTNLLPRSYPYGVSVECFDSNVYVSAYKRMITMQHQEHPTTYFYENHEKYNYFNLKCAVKRISNISLTVDTVDDLSIFTVVVKPLIHNWLNISYLDAVELIKKEKK